MREQFGSSREDYEDEGFMASANECTGLVPFSVGDEVETFAQLYSEVYGFPAPKVNVKEKNKESKKEKSNE